MATIDSGSGLKTTARLEWSATAGNGGSTVTVTLYAVNHNASYSVNAIFVNGFSVTINGNTKTGTSVNNKPSLATGSNGISEVMTHSVWVPYTGSKSITISGQYNAGVVYWGTCQDSVSATVALPTIGSAPTAPTWKAPSAAATISETATSYTLQWNASTSYNNSGTYTIEASVGGGAWTQIGNPLAWGTTSTTATLSNPSQGQTYKFRIKCTNNIGSSSYTVSPQLTMNKVNPPTIGNLEEFCPYNGSTESNSLRIPLSGGSQTTGGAVNLKALVQKKVNLVWTSVGTMTNISGTGNGTATCLLTAAQIYAVIGTETCSSSDLFRVKAWSVNSNNSSSTAVYKNFTVNINKDGGAAPTLPANCLTISGGILGYPASCFVAGVNGIEVNASGSAAPNRVPSGVNVTIDHYKIEVTGCSPSEFNTLPAGIAYSSLSAGTKTVSVTAYDSRGLSATVSKTIMVQSYTPPSVTNLTVSRVSGTPTSASFNYDTNCCDIYVYADGVTKGNQLNAIHTQQYFTPSSTWATVPNNKIATGYSEENVYDFKVRVSDSVKPTTYSQTTARLSSGAVGLAFRSQGIGIGCVPTSQYKLEVEGMAKFQGFNVPNTLTTNTNDRSLYGGDYGTVSAVSAFTNFRPGIGGYKVGSSEYHLSILAHHKNVSKDRFLLLHTNSTNTGSLYWNKRYGTSSVDGSWMVNDLTGREIADSVNLVTMAKSTLGIGATNGTGSFTVTTASYSGTNLGNSFGPTSSAGGAGLYYVEARFTYSSGTAITAPHNFILRCGSDVIAKNGSSDSSNTNSICTVNTMQYCSSNPDFHVAVYTGTASVKFTVDYKWIKIF